MSAQKHYALDQGNIVSQDVGPTGGFGVISVHGGYRWREGVQLTAGIDNLFERTRPQPLGQVAVCAGVNPPVSRLSP